MMMNDSLYLRGGGSMNVGIQNKSYNAYQGEEEKNGERRDSSKEMLPAGSGFNFMNQKMPKGDENEQTKK
jgi:hypothetical protein